MTIPPDNKFSKQVATVIAASIFTIDGAAVGYVVAPVISVFHERAIYAAIGATVGLAISFLPGTLKR